MKNVCTQVSRKKNCILGLSELDPHFLNNSHLWVNYHFKVELLVASDSIFVSPAEGALFVNIVRVMHIWW